MGRYPIKLDISGPFALGAKGPFFCLVFAFVGATASVVILNALLGLEPTDASCMVKEVEGVLPLLGHSEC